MTLKSGLDDVIMRTPDCIHTFIHHHFFGDDLDCERNMALAAQRQWLAKTLLLVVMRSRTMARSMVAAGCYLALVDSCLQFWLQQLLQQSSLVPMSTKSDFPTTTVIDLELLGPEPTGECGNYKCFFRVNSQLGYLLAQDRQQENTNWTQTMAMEGNWLFGNYLAQKFHQRHLMLGPPVEQNISALVATRLNSNLRRVSHNFQPFPGRFVAGTVAIQPVKSAPASSVLLGCNKWKRRTGLQRFQTLLASVRDPRAFCDRLRHRLVSLTKALRAEPCLLNDFQIMTAPTGDVFWIDLDEMCALVQDFARGPASGPFLSANDSELGKRMKQPMNLPSFVTFGRRWPFQPHARQTLKLAWLFLGPRMGLQCAVPKRHRSDE